MPGLPRRGSTGGLSKVIADGAYESLTHPLFRRRNMPDPTLVRVVHATPPIVTVGVANAASTIASAVRVTIATEPVSYVGTNLLAFDGFNYGKPDTTTGALVQSWVDVRDFYLAGGVLEIATQGKGAWYWLEVDGKLVTAVPQSPLPSDGNGYLIAVNVGPGFHRIRLIMNNNWTLNGYNIGPLDTCFPTSIRRPLLGVIGDSSVEGTGTTNGPLEGWPLAIGDYLGMNVLQSGSGATGVVNPGTGGKVKYRDRFTKDILTPAPDYILIVGSPNDASSSYSGSVQTETAGIISDAVAAGYPVSRVVIAGPWYPRNNVTSGNSPDLFAARDGMKNAAAAAGVTFIDLLSPFYFTGTGHIGATTGSGNADLFISSDSTHPTTPGHAYWGRRLAQDIGRALLAA